MANIAISELATEATTLDDNDFLLVSKNNGTSYTSAKMKASVLKNEASGIASCKFSSDTIRTACETAIINKNIVTNDTVEKAISQSFITNDEINQFISINSSRANFIDWSQAIEFKTTLTSESLPYDCILLWSTIPSKIDINFFDVRNVLQNSTLKQCYIESGSDVLITATNSTPCYLVPLAYGSTQLEYTTNDITDWLIDGASRSKIDEYFDSIAIYGGNNTSISQNTQYTKMSQIEGLNCKYWTIQCRPKVNVIITSGGKKQYNIKYNHEYYVSGNYVHATTFTNSASVITNSGKRVLIKKGQYLTMNFRAYNANSTSITNAPANFFNNIQWSDEVNLSIG